MNRHGRADEVMACGRWKVGWGFTARCNMGCPFCYSKTARGRTDCASQPQLAECIAFVERNANVIESINWGTGENALEPQWWSLVTTIRQRHPTLLQAVTTNGLFGHEVRRSVERRAVLDQCIDDIDVSLDFADPTRHNALRAHGEAFAWACETMDMCAEAGKSCSIVMIGCEDTLARDNLDAIFDLAARYSCCVRINVLRPARGVELNSPSYETMKATLCYLAGRHATVSLADPLFAAMFGHRATDASGCTSLRILPDGSVTPSTYLTDAPWVAGNIRDGCLTTVEQLAQADSFTTLANAPVPTACHVCDVRDCCRGGAKDRRILWYGSLGERDPYCPTRWHDSAPWKPESYVTAAAAQGPFIHDGYLPTVIFQPLNAMSDGGPR